MKSKPPPKPHAKASRPDAPPAPEGKNGLWWMHAGVILLLVVASFGVYQRTLNLGFLSVDDPDYIQNNPLLGHPGPANLKRILTEPYFANYAPLNILSYAVDVALAGGRSPFAIHLSNVLWGGWAVCMVYILAFTIRAEILTAAAAAFLFLLHPSHVEVVSWISCRKDLIATGSAALSAALYILCRRRVERRTWWYGASVLCFLLASAAKQSVLLLPLVMLIWDFLIEKRRDWRMLADKIPFGFITLFFGWMTVQAQPSTNHAWSPFVPAATEFVNLWLLTGLGKYVLYREAPDPSAWSGPALIAVCSAAALIWALPLALLRVSRRKREKVGSRPVATGARSAPARISSAPIIPIIVLAIPLTYWVLINMVPPMLLNFMVPITDRYLFFPSVAVCILIACGASEFSARWPAFRWVGWAALTCLAAVWGIKTSNYINEWREPRSVWYGAHFKTKSAQVAQFLGEVYQNAGERVDDFIKPGASSQLTNDFAMAQAVLGDPARSELLRVEWSGTVPDRTNSLAYRDLLWKLAQEQLDVALARRGSLSTPNLFMNRGRLLVREGKPDKAIPEFQNALALAKASSYELVRQETVTHALFAIGVAYWNLRSYKEAEEWLLKAQETQRKSGRVWVPTLDHDIERLKPLAGDGNK